LALSATTLSGRDVLRKRIETLRLWARSWYEMIKVLHIEISLSGVLEEKDVARVGRKLVKIQMAPVFGFAKQEGRSYMYHVMLVDDSEVSLKEIKRLPIWRETPDFVLGVEAGNGAEALRKLVENPVDLVITDIRMPKVNGLELLERIVKQGLAKVVVLLSEYQEFNYARQGIISGAFDYLAKPVHEADLEKLLQRVARCLAEKAVQEQYLRQMEAQLEEKVLPFYPEFEVRLLAEYAASGNLQAESLTCALVHALNGTLDRMKIGFIIQRAIAQIITIIEQQHSWIVFFINLKLIWRLDATTKSGDRLEEALLGLVHELVVKVNKLNLVKGSNAIVKQVCSYVLENVDTDLTIKSLAEALFLHRSYLSEVFKQQTGWKLGEYITMVKLERAKKLIEDGQLLGYQIAGKLGYKDVEYFSRIFKKYTGMPPSRYRSFFVPTP
jgi:two-component system response regulator YesN